MNKKLLELINNRSLQTRMIAVCLLIAGVSIGLMAWFSYSQGSRLVEEQAFKRAEEKVGQAAWFIDDRLKYVSTQVAALVTGPNDSFRAAAGDNGTLTPNERTIALSNLQSLFAGLRIRESLVVNLFLYTPYQSYYELTFRPNPNFLTSRTYFEALESSTRNRWLSPRVDETFRDGNRVIPLVVPTNFIGLSLPTGAEGQASTETGRNFLIVNLSERYFVEYLQSLKPTKGSLVYLAAPDGTPYTVPETLYPDLLNQPEWKSFLQKATAANGFFEYNNGSQALYINYAQIDASGWKVVSLQPTAELLAGLTEIQLFTVAVGLICFLLSVFLASWLAATITRPLSRLKNLMRRVKERDFSVRFGSKYQDEVGELGRAFDGMTGEIDRLILLVEQKQQAKRQAELEALQAQINPHFLYNTLDSIYWKALLKDTDTVAEMAVLLSQLFRLGLNGGRELTTLAREIEHVKGYLEIQKLCYDSNFDYTIEYSPELGNLSVIKLILQPLAENSLAHGFETYRAKGENCGHIKITALRDGDRVCLSVSDNGSGFDAAALLASLDTADEKPQSVQKGGHGYALRNVHARLKLHYGANYDLKPSSRPFEENRLEIWLPAEFEVDAENQTVAGLAPENIPPIEQKQPINIFD
jgi:two-component system, sensor histidine kinase YesM